MISRTNLQKIARAKLEDAEVLLRAQRYDSAVYLWSAVVGWNPEMRYKLVGTTSAQGAHSMIKATKFLLRER